MTAYDNPYSVYAEQFGAVGNGTTDDAQAIRDALAAVGPAGEVKLPNRNYAIGSTLELSHAETLGGLSPSGSVFGNTLTPGAILSWIGPTGGAMLKFGAKNGALSPKETFGGGVRNLQIDGKFSAAELLRIAACGNAAFENLKIMQPQQVWAGRCISATANTSAANLDNTIRNATFRNINMFAWGAAHCFYNLSNGTEGGLTGCVLDMMVANFGYGNGGGNGFYLSSMDDCSWRNTFTVRAPGGSGIPLYLDGNGAVGKNCQGNTFMMVHIGGGNTPPVYADGVYSNRNKIYGLTSIDETPVVIRANGASLAVDML